MQLKSLSTQPPKDFCLMIVGDAGSGKSTLAARFPRPFFLSLDKNLRGPAEVMRLEGKTDIGYFDDFDKDDAGKELDMGLRYNRFAAVLGVVCASPDWDTIVIDNTTMLCDLIMADILRQNARKAPVIQDWGTFGGYWKQIIAKLRATFKMVIFIAHTSVEKDEIDGSLRYGLAIPGKTADVLPTLVTDVWRCEIEEKLVGVKREQIRNVRVVQTQKYAHLKTSSPGLPAVFQANQQEIDKILKAIKA